MTILADSDRTALRFVRETAYNVPPVPLDMNEYRFTGSGMVADKQTVRSAEIQPSGMVTAIPEVAFDSGGPTDWELILGAYNEYFESVLRGVWSTAVNFSGTVTITAATRTINAVGAFADAVEGQRLYINGASELANEGWITIETKTDDDNVVARETTLVDETGSMAIRGTMLRNGATFYSYHGEQAYLDIAVYQLFKGQRAVGMTLNSTSGEIVTGGVTFSGGELVAQETAPFSNSVIPAPAHEPVNATTNVGKILLDYVELLTPIQSIELAVDGQPRMQRALKNKFPVNIGQGKLLINGTLSAYFQNLQLYNRMLTHKAAALQWEYLDLSQANAGMSVTIPNLRFVADPVAPDTEGTDVIEAIEFEGIRDEATNCNIQIDYASGIV